MTDLERRAPPPVIQRYPCADLPPEQRCDHAGPTVIPGHTCGEPVTVWDGSWREGDIFRWQYTDAAMERMRASKFFTDPNWCVSHIGVVRNGLLCDTYWMTDKRTFKLSEAVEKLELTWRGNVNDMDEIRHYEVKYYDPADVVDMTHSNDTRATCYKRRGAQRSRDRYWQLLQEKRQAARSDLGLAISHLEDCARMEQQLRDPDVKLEEVGL